MADPAFTRSRPKPPSRRPGQAIIAGVAALAMAAPAAAQVQVQPLAAPDLFSVGTGPSDLPQELWQGSSAALARAVIPTLGSQPMSPAAAALARHLLSAGAPGPAGAGDDQSLAGARAMALLRLGDAAAVQAITDRTPNLGQKPALSEAAAQAALVLGQEDRACAVGDGLANGRDTAFWLRLRAYCQAWMGQTAPAQLTLQLAEQQGSSPGYERLMDALLNSKPPGDPALDDGLDFVLTRKLIPAWPDALPWAAPPIAVAVARDPNAPPAARLLAAASAARLGFPTPEAYVAVAAIPADLAAADQPGPTGEAGLVALLRATTDLSLKEQAIVALLKRAKDGPEFLALARLAAPGIAQVMAAHPVLREPALIAMAAAAAGDLDSARAARAEVGQGGPPPAPLDLALLDALIAAAGDGPPDEAIADSLAAAAGQADAPARARAAAALALLAGLGAPLGPDVRFGLSAVDLGPGGLTPGQGMALGLAVDAGRLGDVALYVLQASPGAAGPASGDRAHLVRALFRAGLKADARASAVEGLLALQARP